MRRVPIVIGVALLGATLISALPTSSAGPTAPPLAAPTATEAPAWSPPPSLAPLIDAVRPAVVTLKVESSAPLPPVPPEILERFGFDPHRMGAPQRRGEGSGFLISADGLLLTNHHVIDDAKSIAVVLSDGREVPARAIGSDEAIDVAVLKLEGEGPWPYLALGDSEGLKVGDWVLAMGNGLGLGTTATVGIVSGTGRELGHDVLGREQYIQTDAAINQGNSGGPLFDTAGRVVGMNTAIIAGANTVGFAIPASLISEILPDLQRDGRVARGFLGVQPQTLDPDLRAALKVQAERGAVVADVFEDTPAARAGLASGDVVLDVDGTPVASDRDLVKAIGGRRPGDKVALRVERDGKIKELKVVLSERPGEDRPAPPAEGTVSVSALGLSLAPLSPALAAEAGVRAGALVERVARDTPADGRLQAGDVILEVNRRPVSSPADVEKLLARASGTAFLLVLRDDAHQFVALPLP